MHLIKYIFDFLHFITILPEILLEANNANDFF